MFNEFREVLEIQRIRRRIRECTRTIRNSSQERTVLKQKAVDAHKERTSLEKKLKELSSNT